MTNVKIYTVGIYHPEKKVLNDYYLNHFKQRNKDIERFMEHMGRNSRYVIDSPKENGLTMGIAAAENALSKANMTGQDIDMIVFSTQIPEHTFPTNATFIHEAIGAHKNTIVMDSNANCAGMTVAVDQTAQYMKGNTAVKTALIIGSDHNTLVSDPEDEITYANYGDAAAAVILQTTEEDTGLLESIYFTDPASRRNIMFPKEGLANTLLGRSEGRYINWIPFDGRESMPYVFESFETIYDKYGLQPNDIKAYCLSQFSFANVKYIQDNFNIDSDKMIYVGDRFGYTGTSSPFLALNEAIESNKIQRGDYIMFWTIGAGYQIITTLAKY